MNPRAGCAVELVDILKLLPLVTAAVWYLIVAAQVFRDRMRTATEAFFLAACFFAGTYAVSDFYFFNAPQDRPDIAANAALLSISCFTLTVVFFFLFTQVYLAKMRRLYLIALAPGILLLPIVWGGMLEGVTPAGSFFLPKYRFLPFTIWLLFVVVYALAGIWNLWKLHRIVRTQSPNLAKRSGGILYSFIITFFLGFATNGIIGALPNPAFPPPFSTLLAIPGVAALLTLAPIRRERISEVVRKFRSRRYELREAYLIFNDGTLIASKVRLGDAELDKDIFSATLDVIQNFMRTSFPVLKGTSLRTIEHGDYRILIERGRYCYLTVVLVGEENDLLRRQMRDALLEFESLNQQTLIRWKGVTSDAVGADETFRRLFERGELFSP
jgi:hypothetical protein